MCSDYIGYQVTFCFTGEGWHVFRLYRLSGHILFYRGRLACVQIIYSTDHHRIRLSAH